MVRRAGLGAVAAAVVFVVGLTGTTEVAPAATTTPTWARGLPAGTTQVVRTVSSHFWCDHPWCTVTQAWRKVDGTWTIRGCADGRSHWTSHFMFATLPTCVQPSVATHSRPGRDVW